MAVEETGKKINLVPLWIRKKGGQAFSKALQLVDSQLHFEHVEKEVAEERIGICEGCPKLAENRVCDVCLCPMDYKVTLLYSPIANLTFKKELIRCPIGKW